MSPLASKPSFQRSVTSWSGLPVSIGMNSTRGSRPSSTSTRASFGLWIAIGLLAGGCFPDFGEAVEAEPDRPALVDADTDEEPDETVSGPPDFGLDADLTDDQLSELGAYLYLHVGEPGHIGGCAACHGRDAQGGSVGPAIEDVRREAIEQALQTVEEMTFLELTSRELDAIAAYLESLSPGA